MFWRSISLMIIKSVIRYSHQATSHSSGLEYADLSGPLHRARFTFPFVHRHLRNPGEMGQIHRLAVWIAEKNHLHHGAALITEKRIIWKRTNIQGRYRIQPLKECLIRSVHCIRRDAAQAAVAPPDRDTQRGAHIESKMNDSRGSR